METKICKKCGRELPIVCFSKDKNRKDGLQTQCKECRKKISKKYRTTIEGRSIILKNSYIGADRKQGRISDEIPNDYVTNDFIMRLIQQPCVHCGKEGWDVIGLNRLDNNKPHIKSNVEPCCEDCNLDLASEYFKELYRNRKDESIPLDKIDEVTGEVLASYPSTSEAARQNNCNQAHISDCCRGKRKTCGGFIWKELIYRRSEK